MSTSLDLGQSKKDGKDQVTILSSTTPDTGYHISNKTLNKLHQQEPRGQFFPSR